MAEQLPAALIEPVLSLFSVGEQVDTGGATQVAEQEVDTVSQVAEVQTSEPAELLDLTLNPESVEVVAEKTTPAPSDVIESQAGESTEESLAVYNNFTEALRALITMPIEQTVPESDDPDPTIFTALSGEEILMESSVLPLPAIAVTVAERLEELAVEQQVAVAPLLQNITETVQRIETLVTAKAAPEVVETAQVELEEAIIMFFEQLDIEYEEEDVRRFITVLLRPDFRPAPAAPKLREADLEHDGTREAKLRLGRFTKSLTAAERKVQQLIGQLAMLSASNQFGAPGRIRTCDPLVRSQVL